MLDNEFVVTIERHSLFVGGIIRIGALHCGVGRGSAAVCGSAGVGHVRFTSAEFMGENLKCDFGGVAVCLPIALFVLVNGCHVAQTCTKSHVGHIVLHVLRLHNIWACTVI